MSKCNYITFLNNTPAKKEFILLDYRHSSVILDLRNEPTKDFTSFSNLTFTCETFYMEVLGLHPENLSLAWLPTLIALDNQFSWWMVWFLRMGHC